MKPFTLAILLGWLLLAPFAAAFAAPGDVPPLPCDATRPHQSDRAHPPDRYVRFFPPQ